MKKDLSVVEDEIEKLETEKKAIRGRNGKTNSLQPGRNPGRIHPEIWGRCEKLETQNKAWEDIVLKMETLKITDAMNNSLFKPRRLPNEKICRTGILPVQSGTRQASGLYYGLTRIFNLHFPIKQRVLLFPSYFFKLSIVVIFLNTFTTGCVPIAPTGPGTSATVQVTQNGTYQNKIFSDPVKTVQMFRQEEPFSGAVTSILQESPLWLVFDILEGEAASNYDELFVKIVHCNADWQKSQLNNLDFLESFNEFRITDYVLSVNTKMPYTQYRVQMPRVKMPGNYAALVYRNRNENDVLLTQRFMVYDKLVSIGATVVRSSGVKERDTHQQIEFVVNYGSYDVQNPYDGLKVMIRQNQAWYNTIEGLRPTFVDPNERQLEYRHFTLENNFPGGNEYRFFDLRLTRALGQNVGNIDRGKTPIQAFLLRDRSRLTQPYSQPQNKDLNGGFAVGTTDNGTGTSNLEADYVATHFFLEADVPVDGDVYITGDFNNRILANENHMQYDAALKGYMGSLLLKQGYYNYQYYVDSNGGTPSYYFEGSHYQTENQYEIFIYHRPLGARADLLIGYTKISSDPLRN